MKLLFVHTEEIWIKIKKFHNKKKKHKKFEGYIFKKCLNMCIISPSSVLVKKDILIKNGMFNDRLKVCEDYELWIKITSKIPVSLVDKACVVKHGGHTDQLSKKFWGIDRFRIKAFTEKLILYYNLNPSKKKIC